MRDRKFRDYAAEIIWAVGLAGVSFYVLKTFVAPYLGNLVDPDQEKRDRARLQAKAHIDRIRESQRAQLKDDGHVDGDGTRGGHGPAFEEMNLNEYENLIALEMVAASDISVGFSDIAGLEDIIEELRESVIYPLMMPKLYSHASTLLSAPSGVLLYGPPGCGKTMLAKAVARESGASFINLHISTLTEKWYGDSNKLVRAVFTLARKVEPVIIFIDEIDALLGTRRSGEHEASGMVKAEFMTLWDGLTSASSAGLPARIVVLGATNRIHDIDEAILRRMPKKFAVPLPCTNQRRAILELLLSDTRKDHADFNVSYVSTIMEGMSGSDIKEACRDAAMAPVREYLRLYRPKVGAAEAIDPSHIRPLRNSDFLTSPGGFGRGRLHGRPVTASQSVPLAGEASDSYETVDEAPAGSTSFPLS